MNRRILSMLLVLVMLLSIMPAAALAEDAVNDVTYSYENGVLTVSGTGTCTREYGNDIPWNNDGVIKITKVIIKDGITKIAGYAFEDCAKLESVEIAGTVTEIGEWAFKGCTALKSINIPSAVTRIEAGTFAECSSLESINIPAGAAYIGNYPFLNCTSLTAINIPASVTSIGVDPFSGCTSLESITVDSGNNEFYDTEGVLFRKYRNEETPDKYFVGLYRYPAGKEGAEYTVPADVEVIGYQAFEGCININTIDIGAKVGLIGERAFEGCKNLSNVTVDANNTHFKVENNMLYSCKPVVAEDGTLTRLDINGIVRCLPSYVGAYTIPGGVDSVPSGAFADCTKLTTVNFTESVTSIGQEAFKNCSALTEITVPGSVTKITTGVFENCVNLQKAVLEEGITTIGFNVFAGCEKLASVSLPSTMTMIDYKAFGDCKSLTEITIPDGVTTIESCAFEGCEKLEGISLPPNITEIYYRTFGDCKSLTEISIPDKVTQIGCNAFENCTALKKIIIPESLNCIGGAAFRGCSSLIEITIPRTVSDLGYHVFADCTNLTSVKIEDGVKVMNPYTFLGCEKLKNVSLPSTIKTISQGAFDGCKALTDIVIPNGVTSIEYNSFANCSSLENITIPESVTEMDVMAFTNSNNGVFGNIYFAGSREQWQEIVGEDNILNHFFKVIVHYNYAAGQEHTVTNGVCSCGAYSADHTHVYGDDDLCEYCGEKKPSDHEHDFLHGTVGTDSNGTYVTCAVSDCTERTYATVETGKCGENLTYTKTKIPAKNGNKIIVVISGTGQMYYYNGGPTPFKDATEIIFENGATWISMEAFCGNESLQSVTLPSTLEEINWQAFTNCSNLESITLPEGLEEIGWRAFAGCDKIKTVTIPSTVTLIDEPFENMEYYNVAEGNTKYKSIDGALYSKDGKTLYNYPGARTGKAVVSDGTETIGSWAFEEAAKLTSIVIPASVVKIENDTFEGCSSLKVIFFGGTQEQWNNINFTECQHINHPKENYTSKKYLEDNKITVVCLNTEPEIALTNETSDKSTPVSVSGYGNAMSKVTSVTIEKTTLNEEQKATFAVVDRNNIQAYDISLKDESGASVQPDGYVQVRLKVPNGYTGSKCVVYHQESDGTLTPVDAVLEGEYLVFVTDSFSTYVIKEQHDHILGTAEIKNATCTAPGSTKAKCTEKGCNYVSTTEIPASGHTAAPLTDAKNATCTENGSTGERRCKTCDAILQVSQVIEAAGHDYENGKCTVCDAKDPSYRPYIPPVHTHSYTKAVTAPTCTEKGYTTYTCSCGYSYVADYVNANGHTEVVDAAVAATCEKTGLTEGKHCSACNTVLVAQKETPKAAHTEVVDAAVAATCEKTGLTEGKHCSVCNAVLVAQKETPKAAHSFDKGFCTVCGAVDTSYVPFKDVKEGDAFYDDIMWAWKNHIIIGDENGNYNADSDLTRAQVVTMLWRMCGSQKAAKAAGFSDLTQDWYKEAVAWAVEKGIIKGIGNNLFDPDGVCTRAMFVTMLWRLNGFEKAAKAAVFTDLTQDWYRDAVAWAASNGVTKGTSDTTFSPDDNCTRGQAAAFLHRLALLEK